MLDNILINTETKVVVNLVGITLFRIIRIFSQNTHIILNISMKAQQKKNVKQELVNFTQNIPISLSCLKIRVMRFYAVLRISSLPIPLVNLTDLCKKFGTCWHTCAKTCAKSTIFQICLYEAKLNGNNLNYIYNFHKFQLFPIVSVLLSSI